MASGILPPGVAPSNTGQSYGQILWDPDGKPYMVDLHGIKRYVSPLTAAGYTTDPRAREWARQRGVVIDPSKNPGPGDAGADRSVTFTNEPAQTFFKARPQWNDQTGEYESEPNWTNIVSLGALGGIGLGAASAAGAFGAAGGAGAEGAAAGSSGAVAPAAGGAGAVLPSTTIGTGMATLPAGTASGLVPAAAAGAGTGLSTLQTIGQIAGKAGQVVQGATAAAGNNRQLDAQNTLNSEKAWLELATADRQQRADALRDVYRAGVARNPSHGPMDVTPPTIDPNYLATLSPLEQEAMKRLAVPSNFSTANIPPFVPGQPGSPGMPRDPSPLETIGTYAAPALSLLSAFGR